MEIRIAKTTFKKLRYDPQVFAFHYVTMLWSYKKLMEERGITITEKELFDKFEDEVVPCHMDYRGKTVYDGRMHELCATKVKLDRQFDAGRLDEVPMLSREVHAKLPYKLID